MWAPAAPLVQSPVAALVQAMSVVGALAPHSPRNLEFDLELIATKNIFAQCFSMKSPEQHIKSLKVSHNALCA